MLLCTQSSHYIFVLQGSIVWYRSFVGLCCHYSINDFCSGSIYRIVCLGSIISSSSFVSLHSCYSIIDVCSGCHDSIVSVGSYYSMLAQAPLTFPALAITTALSGRDRWLIPAPFSSFTPTTSSLSSCTPATLSPLLAFAPATLLARDLTTELLTSAPSMADKASLDHALVQFLSSCACVKSLIWFEGALLQTSCCEKENAQ